MISISSAFCQALLIAQIWRNIAEDYLMHFTSLKKSSESLWKKYIGCKVGPIFFGISAQISVTLSFYIPKLGLIRKFSSYTNSKLSQSLKSRGQKTLEKKQKQVI